MSPGFLIVASYLPIMKYFDIISNKIISIYTYALFNI